MGTIDLLATHNNTLKQISTYCLAPVTTIDKVFIALMGEAKSTSPVFFVAASMNLEDPVVGDVGMSQFP